MCADPAAKQAIEAIKEEIKLLQERVAKMEQTINGDGSKEKGIIPRLTTIETKQNMVLGGIGALVLAIVPAVIKYLIG